MNKTSYTVSLNFVTPLLGTQPSGGIQLIQPPEGTLADDEIETAPVVDRGVTAFHKLNNRPILYDYQVKGFLKEAGRAFNGLNGVKMLKSKIENFVFIAPRQIEIQMSGALTVLERPIRFDTATGPRAAILRSEMIPEGSRIEFALGIYDQSPITIEIVEALLSYGEDKGLGCWRNAGYGRFTHRIEKQV